MFRIPLRRFLPLALLALAMFALTASGFAQDGEAHKGPESQSVFETIKEGETGWTYPVGDATALAAQVAAALDDPVEARRRAGNGRRLVEENFEASEVFDRLAQLLISIESIPRT